jgi:FKBP-type peptidyl-prolyl cis-trans isomerase FklB
MLGTSSDTLSYAAGISYTKGLMDYLIQQKGVDTAYIADFIEGFKEGIAAEGDMRQKARMAGIDIAGQITQRILPSIQKEYTDSPDSLILALFYRGFTDAVNNDSTLLTFNNAEKLFQLKQQQNRTAREEKAREAGRKFLAENKTKPGVMVTPSGLQYKILKQGDGAVPQRTDKVKVHYEGRLIDGTVFDSSTKHGSQPATFRADQVIKGWTEALTMMPVGSKWQLYIPSELGYGERGAGANIKPFATLIFDVELIDIEK